MLANAIAATEVADNIEAGDSSTSPWPNWITLPEQAPDGAATDATFTTSCITKLPDVQRQ
ncbi:protein of unknown function [Ralstonia solanacearum CFBP2957]|nr:protein of unknown function [Ralstonia solanacearum CFBP2957]